MAVYAGQDTSYTSTTLVPDCGYMARVIGVNFAGREGAASPSLAFRTLHRDTGKAPAFAAKNAGMFLVAYFKALSGHITNSLLFRLPADADFSIECTGDVCVGDTVLLTERLYARDSKAAGDSRAPGDSRSSLSRNNSAVLNSSVVSNARSVSSAKGGRSRKTPAAEEEEDGATLTAGVFLGERTIACHVVRDNYRSAREASAAPLTPKQFGRARRLWLEVVWHRASSEACKPYELRPGVVIERRQTHIDSFEVFRAVWVNEALRRPLREELATLAESFLTY